VEQYRDLVPIPYWRKILDHAKELTPATDASWIALEQEARKQRLDYRKQKPSRSELPLSF
jgi:hypothetical protein